MELLIQLQCTHFPGKLCGDKHNIFLAVQKKEDVVEETPGDADEKVFDIPVKVNKGKDGNPNFLGPFVFGKTGDKFLYLVWLDHKESARMRFRRAKIKLNKLSWEQIVSAVDREIPLKARIKLTDKKGEPICASLKEPYIQWENSSDH